MKTVCLRVENIILARKQLESLIYLVHPIKSILISRYVLRVYHDDGRTTYNAAVRKTEWEFGGLGH